LRLITFTYCGAATRENSWELRNQIEDEDEDEPKGLREFEILLLTG